MACWHPGLVIAFCYSSFLIPLLLFFSDNKTLGLPNLSLFPPFHFFTFLNALIPHHTPFYLSCLAFSVSHFPPFVTAELFVYLLPCHILLVFIRIFLTVLFLILLGHSASDNFDCPWKTFPLTSDSQTPAFPPSSLSGCSFSSGTPPHTQAWGEHSRGSPAALFLHPVLSLHGLTHLYSLWLLILGNSLQISVSVKLFSELLTWLYLQLLNVYLGASQAPQTQQT